MRARVRIGRKIEIVHSHMPLKACYQFVFCGVPFSPFQVRAHFNLYRELERKSFEKVPEMKAHVHLILKNQV